MTVDPDHDLDQNENVTVDPDHDLDQNKIVAFDPDQNEFVTPYQVL